jgi:hypothetical protein
LVNDVAPQFVNRLGGRVEHPSGEGAQRSQPFAFEANSVEHRQGTAVSRAERMRPARLAEAPQECFVRSIEEDELNVAASPVLELGDDDADFS